MKTLLDYLFNLFIENSSKYFIKTGIILSITALFIYALNLALLIFLKRKGNLFVEAKKAFMIGIIILMIFYNIYLFFVIKFNGESLLKWNAFPMDRTNTYVMLLPFFSGYFLLIFLFFKTKKQIKKLL